jgi:hypothetical protein
MTVAIGHADVEQHGVRTRGRDCRWHIGATLQEPHVEPLASQQDAERHHRVALVVRNHDADMVPEPERRGVFAARKLRQMTDARLLVVQLTLPKGTPRPRR